MKVTSILRSIGTFLARFIVAQLIVFAVFITAFATVFTESTNLKVWLAEAGAYEKLSEILSTDISEQINVAGGNANEPLVVNYLNTMAVDVAMNEIVDAGYEWAKGETDVVEFSVAVLPPSNDPLLSQLHEGSIITSDQLTISTELTQQVQTAYSIMNVGALVSILLLVPGVALLVVITKPGKKLKKIAFAFFGPGTSLVITGALMKYQAEKISTETMKYVPVDFVDLPLEEQITNLLTIITKALAQDIIVLGGIVTLIGVVLIAVWLLVKHNRVNR